MAGMYTDCSTREIITYRCLRGSAPEYPLSQTQRVSDIRMHQQLWSSSSTTLVISQTSQATIGARAFSAAATSLEQLAGSSSPFFIISGAVPKVAEDGTVYTILRRLTNNYPHM